MLLNLICSFPRNANSPDCSYIRHVVGISLSSRETTASNECREIYQSVQRFPRLSLHLYQLSTIASVYARECSSRRTALQTGTLPKLGAKWNSRKCFQFLLLDYLLRFFIAEISFCLCNFYNELQLKVISTYRILFIINVYYYDIYSNCYNILQ